MKVISQLAFPSNASAELYSTYHVFKSGKSSQSGPKRSHEIGESCVPVLKCESAFGFGRDCSQNNFPNFPPPCQRHTFIHSSIATFTIFTLDESVNLPLPRNGLGSR